MKNPLVSHRQAVWWTSGLALLLGASLAWLVWGGNDSPLTAFLRRDLTWEAMQKRGAWRVGLDPSFPPFEMLGADAAPTGFDVDLAGRIAAGWGMDVEIVAIGFDSLSDALRASKVDSIVSAYPYDERLTRDFAFSTPYFDAGLRLAVREGSPIQDVQALVGKRVAVEMGSLGDMIGRRLQRQGTQVELVPFETPEDAVKALLERSDVDALLVDNVTLRQAQARGSALVAVGPPLEGSPYVIVAPIRATELQKQIAAALQTLREDGTLATLEDRWFAENH